jgi:hypothetical protein
MTDAPASITGDAVAYHLSPKTNLDPGSKTARMTEKIPYPRFAVSPFLFCALSAQKRIGHFSSPFFSVPFVSLAMPWERVVRYSSPPSPLAYSPKTNLDPGSKTARMTEGIAPRCSCLTAPLGAMTGACGAYDRRDSVYHRRRSRLLPIFPLPSSPPRRSTSLLAFPHGI